MLFEGGIIGFGILVGFTISLLRKCKDVMLLGVILLAYPLLLEFPMHEPCTALLLVVFVALCEKHGVHGQRKTTLNSQGGCHAYHR